MSDNYSFRIEGGRQMSGELIPQGAKNEALQVLCAVLLTAEKMTISNIPAIRDIEMLIQLLKGLGVVVVRISEDTYSFEAKDINLDYLYSEEFSLHAGRIRGSTTMIGPLLGRFGKAVLPKPGGDKIGRRHLDTHFRGFEHLGAKFEYQEKARQFVVTGENMRGGFVLMEEISITGTGNVLMAACLTKGKTTIYNAACEPYIQQLCLMLNNMGAKIQGIGSNMLVVEGVEVLHGTEHRVLPDMIEIGSFIGMAAVTNSEILIRDCRVDQLGNILNTFRKFGVQTEIKNDDIFVPVHTNYAIQPFIDGSILTVYDSPWPGFPPDLISILLVLAAQANGSVLIHQKMFESRLFFVDKLIEMGAQIILCDPHRATVIGLNKKTRLRGIVMTSPDIRAGVALLIAALSAKGTSIIHQVNQIERGYQRIDERLNAIGASIEKVDIKG